MTRLWTAAFLVSAAVAAGCSSQNAQTLDDTAGTPAADAGFADETSETGHTLYSEVDTPAPAPARPAPAPVARKAPAPAAAPAPARTEPAPRPAPAPAPRVEYRELQVPSGTTLPLTLQTALSSETSTVEMPVRARLTKAVTADGYVLLPAGTQLAGTVTEVAEPGRVKGRARVSVVFNQATVDGERLALTTDALTFEGEATKSEDATKIGVGAGIGAALGGILGGGSGAAKGAAIGGAAGTGAVLATKGKQVEIAEGTELTATLASPFGMRVRVE